METIEREVVVPAPPAEVWPALADSGEISAWFGADAEVEVAPGGSGVFRWPDGTERRAVVEEVEPGHRLAFRWLPFQRTAGGQVVVVPPTRVEITLEEVDDGTRVRVVERAASGRPRLLAARAISGEAALDRQGAPALIFA
jgi:uncharacterized protein YndB with AHSA1/START domain